MRKFKSLQEAVHFRKTADPQSYFDEAFWKEEVQTFCSDIEASLKYIRTEITDEEFWFLTEVCEDILECTHDATIMDVFRERASAMAEAAWKEDALSSISDALMTIGQA